MFFLISSKICQLSKLSEWSPKSTKSGCISLIYSQIIPMLFNVSTWKFAMVSSSNRSLQIISLSSTTRILGIFHFPSIQMWVEQFYSLRFLFYLMNFRKKHATTGYWIIYAFSIGYFIFLFSAESGLCRIFFQDVKKIDWGGNNDIWMKRIAGLFVFSNSPKLTFTPFSGFFFLKKC